MNRLGFPLLLILWLTSAPGLADGSAPENLSDLAANLAQRLRETRITLPDGSEASVVGDATDPRALLTPRRLQICLETVTEADAWPAAWLVVQREELDFDLVMRVVLDDAGQIETTRFVFAVPRRDWQPDDVARVAREATGSAPPRKGRRNLVVQGFSTKTVTTYEYDAPAAEGDARGLQALLPEGSLIRQARAIRLEDGRRFTLALVLRHATFVPASCDDCASTLFGHADSGMVRLVLADGAKIVDDLDLTSRLHGLDGRPLVPRYACDESGDEPSVEELFASGVPVELLQLHDLDGDGRRLETALPDESIDCERYRALVVAVRPDGSGLEISGTSEMARQSPSGS